ncbi:MAG: glycosyltransferase [Paludibacter sp.]
MKNNKIKQHIGNKPASMSNSLFQPVLKDNETATESRFGNRETGNDLILPEVLFITSYPPRVCGIATYSQDLITALNNKFSNSFSIRVCALETGDVSYDYPEEVKYTLDTSHSAPFLNLAKKINEDNHIQLILIQHEFGFYKNQEQAFLQLLYGLTKPAVVVFHTVLPNPDAQLKLEVKNIVATCQSIVVMTKTSADILMNDYGIAKQKISVIAHGTHLVPHLSEKFLKDKYSLTGRKVLTTFGLLSSGKSIETTLDALPAIIKQCPEVIFLAIGKTHPEVVKNDGEVYRKSLEQKVEDLGIQDHVKFINKYLDLPTLLEYLQLTDIYLFTTNDPNQAVSGTFAYAMSCGCPIISTPIPHAKEVLTEDTGIIFDFRNSEQLAEGVNRLLNDYPLRKSIITNTLQKIVSTSWENSAVVHAMLFQSISGNKIQMQYNLPAINLSHIKAMTTEFGMIQFSKVNQPDIKSGYTLDDNARALVATCMYLRSTGDKTCIEDIKKYLNFIRFCQQFEGDFLNYVDQEKKFSRQNQEVNLDDSNGRAIWALGYLISLKSKLPEEIVSEAETVFQKSLNHIRTINSTRAMAFAIKGIFYYHETVKLPENIDLVKTLANRLVQMYKHESSTKWEWFEGYLTYANSILPEAMLYAWLMTGEGIYKDIARTSLNFLLSHTFNENGIEVISNKGWLQKGQEEENFGEQPIDVAYTIMTLSKFYDEFMDEDYQQKMEIAFNWFLGNNRLHQIIYNPCTGGCYDGLEETHVNLNQGAESTLSYLLARLTVENTKMNSKTPKSIAVIE